MAVIVGMDPHNRSATIEVVDERGQIMVQGRYGTDNTGYAEMLQAGRRFPERVWAVEGCNGIGKHLAHRLVHDGEVVVDVPAKLSAQVRVFATGNGRKSDPVDAHSVAMAALRTPTLTRVEVDPELVAGGDAGRPARRARPGADTDAPPVASGAVGTCPWWSEEVPVRGPGSRPDRDDQAP